MENFSNIDEFSYLIKYCDKSNLNFYDDKINKISSTIDNMQKEIELLSELVKLSDKEISKSINKLDYDTLVSDRLYFINCILKYKKILANYNNNLKITLKNKDYYDRLIESINYYNDNISKANEIIVKYNYDIVNYGIVKPDFKFINSYKDSILRVISFAKVINTDIDIKLLNHEYEQLCMIEKYYLNDSFKFKNIIKKSEKKQDDISGFIFTEVNDDDIQVKENNEVKNCFDGDDYIFNIDYGKDNKKSHKIKKIKKASKWNKIKNSLKKNAKRIIAGLFVGITMIGFSGFAVGDRQAESFDSNKSNYVHTIKETEETVKNNNLDSCVVEGSKETKIKDEQISNNIVMTNKNDITIGSKVRVDGYIYENAFNAYNEEDSLRPYYSLDDEREISLIYYSNDEGETVLISEDNKDKIAELKALKYEVVAYCTSNVDNDVEYEGWFNTNDVKVLVK